MIAEKLKKGDLIKIVSLSCSAATVPREILELAEKKLNSLGFEVEYADNCFELDGLGSSDPVLRARDFMDAIVDPRVKAIMTPRGGFAANEVLDYLDFDIIAANPKIICGFSDITAVSNAIFKKTGLVTYSGPNFGNFGMLKGIDYFVEYFQKCLMQSDEFVLEPSQSWSDDFWKRDQDNRNFYSNPGPICLLDGKAEGEIVGANLCTFNLLQGTDYMPDLTDKILFLEEDAVFGDHFDVFFDRNLESLLQMPGADKLKALVIGRFESRANIDLDRLKYIISKKPELRGVPIACGFDFGHSMPMFTFPIGGVCKLDFSSSGVKLELVKF